MRSYRVRELTCLGLKMVRCIGISSMTAGVHKVQDGLGEFDVHILLQR